MTKSYRSRRYLKILYVDQQMTPEEIAKKLGVSHMTIYRYLKDFGLKK